MIGQLPPFALSTPAFRFRALASHAGRASLGGDREIALACFMVARLVAGMLPPVMLAPGDAAARIASMRNWLASLAISAPARAAIGSAVDVVAGGNQRAVADAVTQLAEVAAPQLDKGGLAELKELAGELAGEFPQTQN